MDVNPGEAVSVLASSRLIRNYIETAIDQVAGRFSTRFEPIDQEQGFVPLGALKRRFQYSLRAD